MKNIPILFSTDMVKANMDGRKTMTRRTKGLEMFNDNPGDWKPVYGFGLIGFEFEDEIYSIKCPYGNVSDVLWVRESFRIIPPNRIYFKADDYNRAMSGWKPSIHMPKYACRTWLRVTGVRVERLQDISEDDAINEGILDMWGHLNDGLHAYKNYTVTKKEINEPCGHWNVVADNAIDSFKSLWVSIYGAAHWDHNPWVWVVSFERCGMPDGLLG